MTKRIVLFASALLLAVGTPAQGATYLYDFENLTGSPDPGTTLNGQDNWVGFGTEGANVIKVRTDATHEGGTLHLGGGKFIGTEGGTGWHCASRVNNGNWSFDLSDTATRAQFYAIQTDACFDYDAKDPKGAGKFQIINTATGGYVTIAGHVLEDVPLPGGGNKWTYSWYLINSNGGQKLADTADPNFWDTAPPDKSYWQGRLYIDLLANSGEGSGSLYARKLTWVDTDSDGVVDYPDEVTKPDWVPVPGLQDFNLKLVTAGADLINANTLDVRHHVRCYENDNLEVITPMMGDANCDFLVDGVDFTFLKANFGQTGKTWRDADFDGDGLVDGVDFTYLKANFGKDQYQKHSAAAPAPVPEPAVTFLLAFGAAALLRRRRSA